MNKHETLAAATITASAWAAYDYVKQNGLCGFHKPLPGWRIDRLYPDGTIGDYRDDGTRKARCLAPAKLADLPFRQPIAHDPKCPCGYRIVRDVYGLLQYTYTAFSFALGNAHGKGEDYAAQVLTRVLGYGDAAPSHTVDRTDPLGCIRVTSTRLAEVYIPSTQRGGAINAKGLADKVRRRYSVTVHTLSGDLDTFPGSPDTVPPEGWPLIPDGGHTVKAGGQHKELRWLTTAELDALTPDELQALENTIYQEDPRGR